MGAGFVLMDVKIFLLNKYVCMLYLHCGTDGQGISATHEYNMKRKIGLFVKICGWYWSNKNRGESITLMIALLNF
jgi:hypothetical protein